MAWYLNRALANFRAAVNARYPRRDKASDGTLGDSAHAARTSDHNEDPDGSVDAWDMDVEVNGPGRPYAADVEGLKRLFEAHESSSYWIHSDQIAKRATGWRRDPYAYAGPGRNRHDKHVHFNTRSSHENSAAPWHISGGEDDDMPDWFVQRDWDALRGLLESVRDGKDVVERAPISGVTNHLTKAVNAIKADIAELKARPAATVVLTVEDRAAIVADLAAAMRGVVDEELDEQSRAGADTD